MPWWHTLLSTNPMVVKYQVKVVVVPNARCDEVWTLDAFSSHEFGCTSSPTPYFWKILSTSPTMVITYKANFGTNASQGIESMQQLSNRSFRNISSTNLMSCQYQTMIFLFGPQVSNNIRSVSNETAACLLGLNFVLFCPQLVKSWNIHGSVSGIQDKPTRKEISVAHVRSKQ